MELRGLLQAERLSQSSVTPSNFAERNIRRKGLRIYGILGLVLGWKRLPILPGFHLGAIFRCEDLRALQVFIRVYVLCFLLLTCLAGLLLAGGFSDILSVTLREAKNRAGDDKNSGASQADKTRRGPSDD
jgi:hypothetical protein